MTLPGAAPDPSPASEPNSLASMSPEEFRRNPPGGLFLSPDDAPHLDRYLREHRFLEPGESILRCERAGEGNMNCVVRARTERRTFIVKQSRPWVEKYPQFAAPGDRACREIEFHALTAAVPAVARSLPRLLLGDPAAHVLVLEDLGSGGDYTGLYRGEILSGEQLDVLADLLSALHGAHASGLPHAPLPNREMRALNHAHIFEIPLAADNGLSLDALEPGLNAAANVLKADAEFCRRVALLGRDVYLADGPCLLHGDFFPGSFIRTPAGPRLIDPEFCFFGRPEYDLAILVAHLHLGCQPIALEQRLRARYRSAIPFDEALMLQLAGVEIMRRIIGYAQLPHTWPPGTRFRLLDTARRLVLAN